jgi:hypothetical protein
MIILRILNCEIILVYPGESNIILGVLIRGKQEDQSQRNNKEGRGQSDKEHRQPSKAGNGEE